MNGYTDIEWAKSVVSDWHEPDVGYDLNFLKDRRYSEFSTVTTRHMARVAASDFELNPRKEIETQNQPER